jgi:hypothetical protein
MTESYAPGIPGAFSGSGLDALKCDLGFHKWKKYHAMTVRGVGGELGGYYFLPNTLTFFYCEPCYATIQEKTDYKGDPQS